MKNQGMVSAQKRSPILSQLIGFPPDPLKDQGAHPVHRIGVTSSGGSLTTKVSTRINAEDLTPKVVISNNSFRFFKPGHQILLGDHLYGFFLMIHRVHSRFTPQSTPSTLSGHFLPNSPFSNFSLHPVSGSKKMQQGSRRNLDGSTLLRRDQLF